jgi:HlyD family secretion protein
MADGGTKDAAQAQADGLPLLVVRREPQVADRRPSRFWAFFRVARFVPLVMIIMMTGGLIALYFQPPGIRFAMRVLGLEPGGGTSHPIAVPAPAARPAAEAARQPAIVAGLGRILPEGEVVTIAPPFGAGDARIARLNVAEGDLVAQGAVLAVLDNERQLLAAADSARATVGSREASLAQTKAAIAASRDEASAALARAEATAANAGRELDRVEELRRRGYAADQSYEQRRTIREEASREVERLRATLSRYGGDLDNQPDVVVARRSLDAARADLARAEADIDKAYVRAPLAATVLSISVRPGEKPGAAGIMNIADIERMKAEVEIHQGQIGRVALGAPVEVTAPALPRPLAGTVARIGLEVGRQTVTDPSPAASTDARVIKVHVALTPDSAALARRFTNLQVTARIRVEKEP